MAVNLSPVAGAAAQFLDNSGNVLTGGKLFTYAAGTTTPQASYTSGAGTTFHSNPIILDAAGRVPAGGEIWLTDGLQYKFVLTDANDVLIGTWDNLIGINSNFLNYYTQEEIQTATAGQTVFTLSTVTYTPGTNSLSVFVDGVNQYDGSSFAYVETNSTTVTFTAGLHVGALVKFTTAVSLSSGVNNASLVTYDPPFTGGVATTVETKLAESVSVKDFGAIGDGVADDTSAIQTAVEYAINNNQSLIFPSATYAISDTILIPNNSGISGQITIDGQGSTIKPLADVTIFASARYSSGTLIPTYGEPVDVNFCFGITLANFTFRSIGDVLLLEPAIEIQNWNTGCKLENIISRVHDQFLKARSCFYCDYERLWCQTSTSTGAARFLFDLNNNLNIISNCVSADSTGLGIGFKFEGLVTALTFVNNSIEGAAVGVEFTGEVRGANILNCYGESWTDVAVKFSSNFVGAATIDGGYWNFNNDATAYLLEYVEGPSNNIIVTKNNSYTAMPSNANFFKNVSTTVGYNQLTFGRAPINSLSINDFLANTTYFSPELDYYQTVYQTGLRTEVVNTYAKGVYAGKYTNGFGASNGFTWNNLSSSTLSLTTRITSSATQRIYVNLNINLSGIGLVNVAGEFIGTKFYCYDTAGITVPSSGNTYLTLSTVGGYVQINGTMAATISTQVVGEVRLI